MMEQAEPRWRLLLAEPVQPSTGCVLGRGKWGLDEAGTLVIPATRALAGLDAKL